MDRRKVYRVGLVVIVLAVFQPPATLLMIGQRVRGVVVERVIDGSTLSSITGIEYYPRVEFSFQGKVYTILSENDHGYEVGDAVPLIFYKWQPERACILSFGNLFVVSLIELPLGLLIWWAFLKSFPDLYGTSISKRQYIRLLIAGKLKRKEAEESAKTGMSGRILRLLIVSVIALGLLYAAWIIDIEMAGGKLSYRFGVGVSVAIVMFVVLMIQKAWRG
jgi:hypothetical protein